MDWIINAELQFPEDEHKTPEDAYRHVKGCLEVLVLDGLLSHYHLISEPRQVDG